MTERLPDFLSLSEDKQVEIFRKLLFPLILKHTDEVIAPKITDTLIDLKVLEVDDILKLLDNETILKERIDEAKELVLPKVMDYIIIVLNIYFSKYRKHIIPSLWPQIMPKEKFIAIY